MQNNIDWHYHISGRNIVNDVINLNKYIDNNSMEYVYVMSTYFPKKESGVSNYNLYYHLKNIDKTKLYLSLDFDNYFYMSLNEIENILKENRNKIIGIKIYSGYQKIDFNSDKMKIILEIVKNNKLYLMFHTGFLNNEKDIFNPLELEHLIKENQDINIILAHLANPLYKELIYLMNNYKNVYTDISGLISKEEHIENALTHINYIKNGLNDKNFKNILFGTDYPIQNFKETNLFMNKINIIRNNDGIKYK